MVASPLVTVITGSRLHFGPLACGSSQGRQFGGIGVMIETPGFVLSVCRAEKFRLSLPTSPAPAVGYPAQSGEDDFQQRVVEVARRGGRFTALPADETSSDEFPAGSVPAEKTSAGIPFAFHFSHIIPPHCGFGSGTQLALAVGSALAVLRGRPAHDVVSLADGLLRGRRSAIGIHGFAQGGFLIDAGKRNDEDIGTLATRVPVPESWRFVLIMPPGTSGLWGAAEEDAFRRLSPMPAELTGRLCQLALTELLPAVRIADFPAFAEALYEYGRRVGDYFAPVQGGRFAHSQCAVLAEKLRQEGIAGVAQSSWGPTLAVVLPSLSEARQLIQRLQKRPEYEKWTFLITAARNNGATICRYNYLPSVEPAGGITERPS